MGGLHFALKFSGHSCSTGAQLERDRRGGSRIKCAAIDFIND